MRATMILAPLARLDHRMLTQGAVLIPLFAGLLMPGTPSWAFIFYITAIPPIIWQLLRGWRPNFRDPVFAAMFCLWLWSSLTILWNHADSHGHTTRFWIVNALWTLVLLLNFCAALSEEPRMPARLIRVLVYAGAINAVISLVLFAGKGDFTARLWGWGETSNPVMGAAILDVCLLLALNHFILWRSQRWIMVLCSLPIIAFLALSYSRGALLALAVAFLLIILGRRPVWLAVAAILIAAIGLLLWKLAPVLFPVLWQNLASRGSDCHRELWRAAWRAISFHPLIGWGPSAVLPSMAGIAFCPPWPAPHNLYLSILYYTGAVGLLCFAATVLLLGRHLLRTVDGFQRRFWMALGLIPLVVGLTDLVQVIKGPSPMWYILWVPMLLIYALPASAGVTRPSPQAAARRSAPPEDARQPAVH